MHGVSRVSNCQGDLEIAGLEKSRMWLFFFQLLYKTDVVHAFALKFASMVFEGKWCRKCKINIMY